MVGVNVVFGMSVVLFFVISFVVVVGVVVGVVVMGRCESGVRLLCVVLFFLFLLFGV